MEILLRVCQGKGELQENIFGNILKIEIMVKCITVKQPWASLIVEGIKDIENRTWKCPQKYIGKRVLIHAGMSTDKEPYMLFNDEQADIIEPIIMNVIASYDIKGFIIGSVEIVDCVINHPSVWAEKASGMLPFKKLVIYNWVLANPIKFDKPIPCKGKLSFWDYNGELPL